MVRAFPTAIDSRLHALIPDVWRPPAARVFGLSTDKSALEWQHSGVMLGGLGFMSRYVSCVVVFCLSPQHIIDIVLHRASRVRMPL